MPKASAATDVGLWGAEPSTCAQPLPVIWPLLGRHIAFHRRLVDLTDSVKAALLLSQSIYWTRRGRDIAERGGWFHKSIEQWTWETGLSHKEQRLARDALSSLGLVKERRMGVGARAFFRLEVAQLGRRLSDRITGDRRSVDWNDLVAVAEMLGPAVAYHRTLAGIGGGVHAGLLLSRALYLTRIRAARDLDGWICSSTARWSRDIGLTRREQETARRDLARVGVWEEALRGVPPSLVARVRLDDLLSLLTHGRSADIVGTAHIAGAGCGSAADRFRQNGKSSLWQPHMLNLPFAPSQTCPLRHPSIYMKSTSESVQPQHRACEGNSQSGGDRAADTAVDAAAGASDGGGGGGDLIFPLQLQPRERAAAHMLLRSCAEQAQELLDELSGRLQAHGVRGSPVGYLRGLIARAQAGTFIAELGPAVAAERRNRQLAAEQCAAREAQQRREQALRDTPEYQARVRAQRERLSQLRDDMQQRMAAGRPR